MNRIIKNAGCLTLVVGTTMSMAVAQTQADRDRQNRPGQSTPQNDATRSQPGTNTGTSGTNTGTSWSTQNTTRDGTNRDFMDEYFGRPSSTTADYTKLGDLSGAWKLNVTMYDPNSSDMRVLRTATGYAERRWILNGTKLAESYTLDGDHNALPFRGIGMNMQGMNHSNNWNDKDRQNTDRDNMDRDRTRRDNMNDPNRNTNQNNPNQNTPNDNNQDRPRDQGSGTGTPTPGATGASGNQPVSTTPASTSSTSGTGTGVNWNNQNNSTTPSNQNTANQNTSNQNTPGQNTSGTHSGTTRMASTGGMGKGVCLWGYDAADREFTVVWMDDQTSAIRFDEGKLGTNNELTLTGKYVDPRDNKTYQTKTVITMDSPNQQRVTMYRDGGILSKEVKVFEITYTRDSNPTWISPNAGNAYGTVPTDTNRSEP